MTSNPPVERKISNIGIRKEVTRYEKDETGKRVPFKKEIVTSRRVQVVSKGARFGHYIVDYILVTAIALALEFLLEVLFEYNSNFGGNRGWAQFRVSGFYNFDTILTTVVFYSLFENFLGQTPGKMITGTVVIDEYAQKPSLGMILLRSVCRFVPFEAFSCLSDSGRGWHDRWTNTYVVPKAERDELQRILAGHIPEDSKDYFPEFELESPFEKPNAI